MNVRRISIFFVLILVSTVTLTALLLNSMAQSYMQMSLPEGVKARIGKGSFSEIAFSVQMVRCFSLAGMEFLFGIQKPVNTKGPLLEI